MTIKIEQLFQIGQLLSDIQNNKPGQDLMDQFLELVRTGKLQYRDILLSGYLIAISTHSFKMDYFRPDG